MTSLDATNAERDALRQRQGAGARYDADNAPASDLLHARRGAANFARHLNSLTDAMLAGLSSGAQAGWTRAHVVADISYQARSLAIALSGLSKPLSPDEATWSADVALAATLPPRALRHLYAHTDVHLNVEFRDLSDENWDAVISYGAYKNVPVRSLPDLRAKSIWRAAYDLGAEP